MIKTSGVLGLLITLIVFASVGIIVWKFGNKGSKISEFISIGLFGTIIALLIFWIIRNAIYKKIISKIDETNIVKQWFSYLNVKDIQIKKTRSKIHWYTKQYR